MRFYYVNNKAQSNGDHELHKQECAFLSTYKKYLGLFDNCNKAIIESKKTYKNSNSYFWCSISF
jgi:hypothetical protein